MKEELMNIVKNDRKKLLILFLLAIVAIFLMVIGNQKSSSTQDNNTISADTTVTVKNDIEEELEGLLSSIDGAGRVDAVIYWDGTGTDHFAYDEELKETISDDGTSERTEQREMVLLNGDGAPVLISHENAEIQGVLIVSEGAVDDRVRKSLTDAASSCLGIGKHHIDVQPMEVR